MKALVIACLAFTLATSGRVEAQSQQQKTHVMFSGIIAACKAIFQPKDSRKKLDLVAVFDEGQCAGIVQGIMFTSPQVCLPEGANVEQAVRVVVNYADKIPARWHEWRITIIEEALARAWPCKR